MSSDLDFARQANWHSYQTLQSWASTSDANTQKNAHRKKN